MRVGARAALHVSPSPLPGGQALGGPPGPSRVSDSADDGCVFIGWTGRPLQNCSWALPDRAIQHRCLFNQEMSPEVGGGVQGQASGNRSLPGLRGCGLCYRISPAGAPGITAGSRGPPARGPAAYLLCSLGGPAPLPPLAQARWLFWDQGRLGGTALLQVPSRLNSLAWTQGSWSLPVTQFVQL